MYRPEKIRNVAIIAHIDHGKTTLLDSLLGQSDIFRDNEIVPERVMDSFDQEKERGITIYAKHTSLFYEDFKINLIDTPGHADFSGEVERVLGMVNCVLLLVDAQDGPMPQTRFVLTKALAMGLKPIVLINKIDRPHAEPDRVLNETFDLFVELGATDEQLDFSVSYTSALQGFALKNINDERKDMRPLFELIIEKVSPPPGCLELPFLMQAMTLSYDDFVGRQATGRILEGTVKKGDTVSRVHKDGKTTNHRITRIEGYIGIKRTEMDEAGVGDIINLAGIPEIDIGDTLCNPEKIIQLPPISLSEPTVSVKLSANTSPFAGKEGSHVTMNKIRERLMKEKRANISLKIEELSGKEDCMQVSGRGELHIAVLLETMRREGYEITLSKPHVILKKAEDGSVLEPFEIAHLQVPEEFSGSVIEELSRRKGELRHLETNEHSITTLEFHIPTRGLMGFRSEFLTMTKGLGIISSLFDSYAPFKGEIPGRKRGSLIAHIKGKTTPYALYNLQDRGTLFIGPTQEVYEGMVVGEHTRDNDLVVNVTREKQLTNIRSSKSDEAVTLIPARPFTLEQAMDFIQDDERIEITPLSLRIRKAMLSESERKRNKRS